MMLFMPQNKAVFPKFRMENMREAAVVVPRVAWMVLPMPRDAHDTSFDL